MGTALAMVAGMLVGGFLGYMLGVLIACELFDMGNLCGFVGVFITGPIGLVGGGLAIWVLCRRR
jgi:hypothetical protein